MKCECGCGEETPLYKKTVRRRGQVKGQPQRFVNRAHGGRAGGGKKVNRDHLAVRQDRGFETPCWIWTGVLNNKGYGMDGERLAHRVQWEKRHGSLPGPEVHLHHLCHVTRCVNPDHLERHESHASHWREHRTIDAAEVQRARAGGERPKATIARLGISRTSYYRSLERARSECR